MIKVKRVSDGKVFTYDNYKDEIRSVVIKPYYIEVLLSDWCLLICPKQDIPLDGFEEGQQLGELL